MRRGREEGGGGGGRRDRGKEGGRAEREVSVLI